MLNSRSGSRRGSPRYSNPRDSPGSNNRSDNIRGSLRDSLELNNRRSGPRFNKRSISHSGHTGGPTGCLKTRIRPPDKARGDATSAAYSSICEHWRAPRNAEWRPQAQFFNSLARCSRDSRTQANDTSAAAISPPLKRPAGRLL